MFDYVLPSNESHIQVSGKYFRILGLITGWVCDNSADVTVDVVPDELACLDPNVGPNEPADADPNNAPEELAGAAPNPVDPNEPADADPNPVDPYKHPDAGLREPSPNIAAIVIDFQ